MIQKEFEIIFTNYPELAPCREDIWNTFHLLRDCYYQGGLILTCGNGGSASDAEHIVGELMKGFKLKRPLSSEQRKSIQKACPKNGAYLADHLQQAIPAISLVSQTGLSSAFINDVAADMVFAQQVLGYGTVGDVLIGLSTSGNSKNVINACQIAKALGMKTIALTGATGGLLNEICDVTIRVPASETYRIQEYHLPIYHALCAMLEQEVFGEE